MCICKLLVWSHQMIFDSCVKCENKTTVLLIIAMYIAKHQNELSFLLAKAEYTVHST